MRESQSSNCESLQPALVFLGAACRGGHIVWSDELSLRSVSAEPEVGVRLYRGVVRGGAPPKRASCTETAPHTLPEESVMNIEGRAPQEGRAVSGSLRILEVHRGKFLKREARRDKRYSTEELTERGVRRGRICETPRSSILSKLFV